MATSTTARPTALITGAAQRVGAAIATHLAAQGYDLVLHYRRSAAEAEALAAQLRAAHGVTVTLHQADLTDSTSLADFWRGLPACQLLICNAATYEKDSLASMQAAKLREQLAVNFEAPLLLAQGFMAQLPAGAAGHIVILGDGAQGWSISPHFFSYAASKAAWQGVIGLLAASVAPQARANLIAMGPTLPNVKEDPALFARLAQHAPLKRNSSVPEVLTALDFLMAAPGVTGQVIELANGHHVGAARPVTA